MVYISTINIFMIYNTCTNNTIAIIAELIQSTAAG